jgi:protein TonB
MFESSLVESSTFLHNRSRLPTLISLGIQAVLVAAFIAIPMLHPEVLSLGPSKLYTLTPPPIPALKPPPEERPHVTTTTAAPSTPSAPSQALTVIRTFLNPTGPAVESPALAVSMNTNPAAPGLPGLAPVGPSVTVAPAVKPGPPTRISQGVLAGLLLAPIQPTYPPIAKVTHTEGTVVIQAIISKSGRIESAHVLSGSPMLQAAALDAVRSARYRPYLLNNEPTEVETTISIIFHLGS